MKDRLPPGQHRTEKWPVLHEGEPLPFNPGRWRLKVHGSIQKPGEFSWKDFESWPKTTLQGDFHCVTRWSMFDNEWHGTRFRDFAALVLPKPETRFVRFADHQGYDTSVPFSLLMEGNAMLVTHRNGEPVSSEHGGPMRLVVPERYGWKSCKWLVEMEFLEKDRLGYWELRGYHNNADPDGEERFS